jgi:hypothetical protein
MATKDAGQSKGLGAGERVVYENSYDGFESFSDYWRDMDEAIQDDFNPKVKGIPGEFQGTFKVTITYTPAPEEV